MIGQRGRRCFFILSLVSILSGCSGSRVSVLPGRQAMPENEEEIPHVLAVGDDAVVVLLDGKEHKGEVIEISPSSLVLGRTGNYGYEETRVESNTIKSIAWVNNGSIWPFIVVVVVGSVVWIGYQVSQMGD